MDTQTAVNEAALVTMSQDVKTVRLQLEKRASALLGIAKAIPVSMSDFAAELDPIVDHHVDLITMAKSLRRETLRRMPVAFAFELRHQIDAWRSEAARVMARGAGLASLLRAHLRHRLGGAS